MESTSTYWKRPFYCDEEVMTVWLLDAARMEVVPGRKSEVRDPEWIAQPFEHGCSCRRPVSADFSWSPASGPS